MRTFVLLLSLGVALLWSCDQSEKPTEPSEPEESTPAYADYVWFDTASYLISAQFSGDWEPFVDGDSIIGEPFIDMNGNGVYDLGIDGFIISLGEGNMDLNHNGRHDGPYDPYTVGTPFDDYDHDGVYDYPNFAYDEGEPFHDCNRDGIWTTPAADEPKAELYQCKHTARDSIRFYRRDSVYKFVSDSGYSIWKPRRDQVWDYHNEDFEALSRVSFHNDDTGLIFSDRAFFMFPVLDPDDFAVGINVDTGRRITVSDTIKPVGIRRTVSLGDTLVIYEDTLVGVLSVTIDSLHPLFDGTTYPYNTWSYRFYFSRELGFIGLDYDAAYDEYYYFPIREDTIPLPMTTEGGR